MHTRIPTLVALCLIAAAPAFAVEPLLRPLDSGERELLSSRMPRTMLRRDVVKLDPRQVVADGQGARELLLPLFPDVQLSATLLRFEKHGERTVHWHGRADDDFASMVVLTIADDRLVGTVLWSGRRFVIAWLPSGNYAVAEVDVAAMPANDPMGPSDDGFHRGEDGTSFEKWKGGAGHRFGKWGDTEIDIMVLWSTDVNGVISCEQYSQVFLGGVIDCFLYQAAHQTDWSAIIENVLVPHAIAEANFVFANSGLGTPLNLVHVQPVAHQSSGTLSVDLSLLRNGQGIFAYVDAVRNAREADVVMLVTDHFKPDLCGIASVPPAVDPFYEAWAYGVVAGTCLIAGDFTFVHELGHIMGAQHDWYAFQDLMIGGIDPPPATYAHGYTVMPQGLMSIMAYPEQCEDQGGWFCERIPFFSDGAMFGQPETAPRPADNARMLSESLWTVANYR